METVRWYVDGCHDPEDPKTATAGEHDDAQDVVRAIVDGWWHKHGDYSTAFDVVIVSPTRMVGRYPVEVESVPHFVIGKPH